MAGINLTPGEIKSMGYPMRETSGLKPNAVVDGRFKVVGGLAITQLTVICEARELETGDSVALKVPRKDRPAAFVMAAWEAKALAELGDAPNVVEMVANGINPNHPEESFIALELASHDLSKVDAPTNREEAGALWSDLMGGMRGLKQMHDNDRIHGDVKRCNMLVFHDSRGRLVKLADLGTASKSSETKPYVPVFSAPSSEIEDDPPTVSGDLPTIANTLVDLALTISHIGPERFAPDSSQNKERRQYNRATKEGDIHAWGVTAFELLTGRTPWHEKVTRTNARTIIERGPIDRSVFADFIPRAFIDVIYQCLDPAPGMRPTAEEIIAFNEFWAQLPRELENLGQIS